jgi:hypothetical protein
MFKNEALSFSTSRYRRHFIIESSIILLTTGLLKLHDVLSSGAIINASNPIFPLPNNVILISASIIEMLIAGYLICASDIRIKLGLITYIGGVFCAYRLALAFIGYKKTCGCLGRLGLWLSISSHYEAYILTFVSICMFFIGIIYLVSLTAKRSV